MITQFDLKLGSLPRGLLKQKRYAENKADWETFTPALINSLTHKSEILRNGNISKQAETLTLFVEEAANASMPLRRPETTLVDRSFNAKKENP